MSAPVAPRWHLGGLPRDRLDHGRPTAPGDRGSGTVLMMSVITITAMSAFLAACLMAWFGAMHQARTAADLAAVAAAQAYDAGLDACAAADATAAANHTAVSACAVRTNGFEFVVRVTVSIETKPRLPFGPAQFTHASEAGYVG